MNLRLATTVAGLLLTTVLPAKAVILDADDVGAFGTTPIVGQIDGTLVNDLSGQLFLRYTGLSPDGLTWNFDYGILNTSTGDITSRISSWGITTDPAMLAVASTGLYQYAQMPPNGLPGFLTFDTQNCFGSTEGTCTGGAGVLVGDPLSTGTFSLTFGSELESLELQSAWMRFQSILGSPLGTSGAGETNGLVINPLVPDPPAVPIPGAVWLFGTIVALVGGMRQLFRIRRRRALAV